MNTAMMVTTPMWQQISTADTGSLLVQNCNVSATVTANKVVKLVILESDDPNTTMQNGKGHALYPGQSWGRGAETGHVWVRSDGGGLDVAVSQ